MKLDVGQRWARVSWGGYNVPDFAFIIEVKSVLSDTSCYAKLVYRKRGYTEYWDTAGRVCYSFNCENSDDKNFNSNTPWIYLKGQDKFI